MTIELVVPDWNLDQWIMLSVLIYYVLSIPVIRFSPIKGHCQSDEMTARVFCWVFSPIIVVVVVFFFVPGRIMRFLLTPYKRWSEE